ncbi:Circadian clock protein kinase KaiC [Candidatus Bilamarchaeum dharawalense]|uniref:Circadian clock protein kinase KaiC n=1 Tax=Candidatus Bilamarchaeum dharawalense TaxID=2885759 RepID=A0A5E4LPI8_9ARCH|nr:Circadian clock protein kinase KaiC [Candidatus Bilamarchaeum dharawalense]
MEDSCGFKRIPSGIQGLDSMIGGGFPENSAIMVRGGTGTCKTNLCIQYLYVGALKYKDPGVMITFAESKTRIHQHAHGFDWDLDALEKKGMFTIIRYEPHEVLKVMEEGGGSVRDTIESLGAKRVVIDSITAYEMLFEKRYRANESILNLFEMLRSWKATTLVTSESPVAPNEDYRGRTGFLSDGIIHMYNLRLGQHRLRALEVIKMRDTTHTDQVRMFKLGKNGVEIGKELKNVAKF